MKYLVDANVLSEPTKSDPDLGVVEWLRANERDIAVDPIILGEIRFGILLLQGHRRNRLERGSMPACSTFSACPGTPSRDYDGRRCWRRCALPASRCP